VSAGENTETSWQDFDSFIETYEVAWRRRSIPNLVDFLPDPLHPRFREVLIELARVDLELRWKFSQPLPLEQYFSMFPELRNEPDAVSQLAFEEYRARRSAGQPASATEYAACYGIATSSWLEANESRADLESDPAITNERRHPDSVTGCDSELDGDQLSQLLPGFRVLGELGRGAFSRVYLARQLDLANRLVVLKISTESFAEADKMAQLQHANIVPIYSVHRAGQLFAVCMPFFGATTLADLVGKLGDSQQLPMTGVIVADTVKASTASTRVYERTETPPSLESRDTQETSSQGAAEQGAGHGPNTMAFLKQLGKLSYVEAVLTIGEQLADGLKHAHERGIIHRDLKPANVLLAEDGRPMLLDFNLSEDLKPAAGRSNGMVGGTLQYMAPEQLAAFQNHRSASDPRSDLYSLGAMLYELLTGRQPFPGRNGKLEWVLTTMRADRLQAPARPRKFNASVSPAIEAIVLRCLEPDPQQRYQHAVELAEDLQRQMKHLPLKYSREPSLRERAVKWTLRHPRLTAVTTITILVASLAYGVTSIQEQKRIAKLRFEVNDLMRAGQEAMDHDEPDVAQGRFRAAWMKVQAEPALLDYQPGVAGWLDHSRRAVIQQQWKKRVPPRIFEERRDEAILLSLLLDPAPDNSVAVARDAIHAALELTVAGDPGWEHGREQLLHVEADLITAKSDAKQALTFFDKTDEFSSRAFLEHRAELLEQLGRQPEALQLRQQAKQFPPDEIADTFLKGINRLRRREFDLARQDFDRIQDSQPENFASRLFQAVCLLNQNRPSEAKVALSACIAQRPYFMWSYFFRAQSNVALHDLVMAAVDFRRVLELTPPEPIRDAAQAQFKLIDKETAGIPLNAAVQKEH
jgi:serine/threonine protein kinase